MAHTLAKLICRTCFVMVGLVPLCGSLGYAAWQQWSLATLQRGDWLAARLGVDVKIEALRQSKPGLAIADRAKLLDPETGQILAGCQAIHIRTGPQATAISIETASIPSQQTTTLWRMLHDRLLKQSRLLEKPIVVAINRISVDHPTGDVELTAWRMECASEGDRRHARISFRSAYESPSTRAATINIIRDSKAEVPVTRVVINAPDVDVDGCLLSGPSSWLYQLGDHVNFKGQAWVDLAGNNCRGEITGQITGIQMDRIVDERFPHRLTGTASLDIAQAVFERNRLQELNATCTIQSGAISFEFVKSMQRLGLIAADSLQTPVPSGSAMIPCDEFAALISIQPAGIIVRGICNPPGDGTVIISRSAPILRDRDTEKRLSNLRIISALLDNDDQSVLFTEMGDLLWRTLPLGPPPSSN